MKGVAWMLVVAMAAVPSAMAGQSTSPPTPRDTLVMRLIAFRAPCPDTVPAAWSMSDPTLASGLRCSLVQAAALALRDRLRARPDLRSRNADPWRPLCVRVAELRNTGTTGLPGDWVVLFDLTPEVSADLIVDRQTGALVTALIGDGSRRRGPPCSAGRP